MKHNYETYILFTTTVKIWYEVTAKANLPGIWFIFDLFQILRYFKHTKKVQSLIFNVKN